VSAFEVGACGWIDAASGDRDAVEGAVELAVAAAVEPVALPFKPTPGRHDPQRDIEFGNVA